MTAHCATCNCPAGPMPQPASSSPGIRRMALEQTAEAVRAAREKRTTVNPEEKTDA